MAFTSFLEAENLKVTLTPPLGPSCVINDLFLSADPGLHAFTGILSPGLQSGI